MATPFQTLLITQMDQRGWKAADLVRASRGTLSKQSVSAWMRNPLRRMISDRSIDALASALSVHPDVIRRSAAASTGVPVGPVPLPSNIDLADIPPDVLILEIARRIGASQATAHHASVLAAYRPGKK